MEKYCKKCNKDVSTEEYFCPGCRNILMPKRPEGTWHETNMKKCHKYVVEKWIPSMFQILSRHQGEFSTLKEWYDVWKKETPGSPHGGDESDRSGSFYANVKYYFEYEGIMVWKNGRLFVNDDNNNAK